MRNAWNTPDRRYALRSAAIVAVLAAAGVLLHASSRPARPLSRHQLREVPTSIQGWAGVDQPLRDRIVEAAGVDDYINRLYVSSDGSRLEMYVGYYTNQRSGDLIHSPRNCLPGAGWEPVRTGRLPIQIADGRSIVVNSFLVQKGLEQRLVLYWYQGRGRVIASEYSAKAWMIADAVRRNRTDGALVRLAISIPRGEAAAREQSKQFVQALYPMLYNFIPD